MLPLICATTSGAGRMDVAFCTPAEAARLLGVTAERARQLIFLDGLLPIHVRGDGRRLVRRADVVRAAELAGHPGEPNRWTAVKAETTEPAPQVPAPWRPGRPSPHAQMIADLPWPQLVQEYRSGAVTIAGIAAHYHIGVTSVRKQLRAHGADLGRHGAPRAELSVSDEELTDRYNQGATLADLAAECGVSTSMVWRRIHFREAPLREPPEPPPRS